MEQKDNKSIGLIVFLSIIFISLLSGVCALTITYKNSESNSVIIYFQGIESPQIEYRLEKGNWHPKMAVDVCDDMKDFTHKVVIPVEDGKGIVAKIYDGNGNTYDNSGRNYEFEKGIWLFLDNGAVVRLEDAKKFNIVKFEVTPNVNSISTGMEVTLTASTMGGSAPYSYKFVATDATGAQTVISEYSNMYSVKWKPKTAGNYKLSVIAKDSSGVEIEESIEAIEVVSLGIKDITSSLVSPQKAGTTIPLTMEIENTANLELTCYYEIKNEDGEKEKLEATTSGAADWTPESAGEYEITGYIESGDSKSSKTIEYTIEEEVVADNEVIIYYHCDSPHDIFYGRGKEGSSYSDIEMTGASMTQDNSQFGFEYKYSTSIADDEVLVVYFLNNQNGEYDDNDGKYYVLREGTYGIKNNQVYNISDSFNVYDDMDDIDDDDSDYDNGSENRRNNNSNFNWNSFYNRKKN